MAAIQAADILEENQILAVRAVKCFHGRFDSNGIPGPVFAHCAHLKVLQVPTALRRAPTRRRLEFLLNGRSRRDINVRGMEDISPNSGVV